MRSFLRHESATTRLNIVSLREYADETQRSEGPAEVEMNRDAMEGFDAQDE